MITHEYLQICFRMLPLCFRSIRPKKLAELFAVGRRASMAVLAILLASCGGSDSTSTNVGHDACLDRCVEERACAGLDIEGGSLTSVVALDDGSVLQIVLDYSPCPEACSELAGSCGAAVEAVEACLTRRSCHDLAAFSRQLESRPCSEEEEAARVECGAAWDPAQGFRAETVVIQPPRPGERGPEVRGTVLMPPGTQLAAEQSLVNRVAALAVSAVQALTGNVNPVGRNVRVTLELQRDDGVLQEIDNVITDDQGGYVGLRLPTGTTEGVTGARYMVSVGSTSADTLTRAFVCSTGSGSSTNIDFRSEAVVRLIELTLVEYPTCRLSDFSPSELCALRDRLHTSEGFVAGSTAEVLNANATERAYADLDIRTMLRDACGRANDDLFDNSPWPRS